MNTFIENKAAPILQELLTTDEPLPFPKRRVFAYFIANLFLRVPSTFAAIAIPLLDAMERMDEKVDILLAQLEASKDQPPKFVSPTPGPHAWTGTPQEWKRHLQSMRQDVESGKPMMRSIMSFILDLAPIITDMTWVLGAAPNTSFFVTSNNPVSLTHLDGSWVGVGWSSPSAFATLPLSPNRYLLLSNKRPSLYHYAELSNRDVDVLNLRTLALATSAIYSPKPYNPARDKLQEWFRSQNGDVG